MQSLVNLDRLHVGSIIYYRLKPCEMPTNPNKLWAGKVVAMLPAIGLLNVESIEDGYRGLNEGVWVEQIISISD